MSNLDKVLTTISPSHWQVEQLIIMDWYDGPIEGFCEMSNPNCYFFFKAFADKFTKDDMDVRLYTLQELSSQTFQEITNLLIKTLGECTKPLWIPRWEFENVATQLYVESFLNKSIKNINSSNIILQTQDMFTHFDVWIKR